MKITSFIARLDCDSDEEGKISASTSPIKNDTRHRKRSRVQVQDRTGRVQVRYRKSRDQRGRVQDQRPQKRAAYERQCRKRKCAEAESADLIPFQVEK